MIKIFLLSESIKISEISRKIGGELQGDSDLIIDRIISPDETGENALCFVWNKKEILDISEKISLVTEAENFPHGSNGIAINDPRNAMINFLEIFSPLKRPSPGIHPKSLVSPAASISPGAYIGPFCVISDNAVIEDSAVLRSNVYVGDGSHVGSGTVIEPNVTIYGGCVIGESCILHSGSVIGSEGFGFIPGGKKGPRKIPQVGGVCIGDNVEIGSSTTVDRGTIGDTVIGDNVKIDNQVQIGHNVKIGRNCIIVAQAGLAGSSVLEENVVMAARSGTGDHVRIGSGSTIAAKGGAVKDVSPGSVVSGFPARDHRKNFRIAALIQRLPTLFERVKFIEKTLEVSSKEDH